MSMFEAATINLNTGLNASNTLITTSGAPDAHWMVTQLGGGTAPAQVLTSASADCGLWLPDGPNSSWIGRNASSPNNGPAPYTFSTTFDLTGFNLSTVMITGFWAIDDVGTLALNGNMMAVLGEGSWSSLSPFGVAAGSPFFKSGINTLSITMNYNDLYIDGVRLEGTLTGSLVGTPEPSTFAMLLGGLGMCAFGARSRLRRKA